MLKTFEDLLYLFGERVRYYRTNKGYTQDELAQLSGLHRSYIGQVERGEKNLCLKNIFIFSKCLNVEPVKLFTNDTCEFEEFYYHNLLKK